MAGYITLLRQVYQMDLTTVHAGSVSLPDLLGASTRSTLFDTSATCRTAAAWRSHTLFQSEKLHLN